MTLAGRVFGEENVAGLEDSLLATADLDLDETLQHDHKLSRRRWMPVEIVTGIVFAEENAGGRRFLGETPDGILSNRDLAIFKMRLVVVTRVKTRVLQKDPSNRKGPG